VDQTLNRLGCAFGKAISAAQIIFSSKMKNTTLYFKNHIRNNCFFKLLKDFYYNYYAFPLATLILLHNTPLAEDIGGDVAKNKEGIFQRSLNSLFLVFPEKPDNLNHYLPK
jgi:hypothetical protein